MVPAVAIDLLVWRDVSHDECEFVNLVHRLEHLRLELCVCALSDHHGQSAFSRCCQVPSGTPQITILKHLECPAIDDLGVSAATVPIDRMDLLAMEAKELADSISALL